MALQLLAFLEALLSYLIPHLLAILHTIRQR